MWAGEVITACIHGSATRDDMLCIMCCGLCMLCYVRVAGSSVNTSFVKLTLYFPFLGWCRGFCSPGH